MHLFPFYTEHEKIAYFLYRGFMLLFRGRTNVYAQFNLFLGFSCFLLCATSPYLQLQDTYKNLDALVTLQKSSFVTGRCLHRQTAPKNTCSTTGRNFYFTSECLIGFTFFTVGTLNTLQPLPALISFLCYECLQLNIVRTILLARREMFCCN